MTINTPNYKILHFDLSIARTQEEFNIFGGFIGVKAIKGDFFIQLDDKSTDPINLKLLPLIRTKFEKIYISNTSQSGGYILLVIGKPCEFDASLGTINSQHSNIEFPHQNIPSIKPTPITRIIPPPVIYPPAPQAPPDPVPPTQILASNTIQYHDSNRVHVDTTAPIDIYISTPIQIPLSGTKKISITAVEGVDNEIHLLAYLLSNNVRTRLSDNLPDPAGNPLPYTSICTLPSHEYSIGDQIIIVGEPSLHASPNLIFDDFKIMFDII